MNLVFRFIFLLLIALSSPLTIAQENSSNRIATINSAANRSSTNHQTQSSTSRTAQAAQSKNLKNALADEFKVFQSGNRTLRQTNRGQPKPASRPQNQRLINQQAAPSSNARPASASLSVPLSPSSPLPSAPAASGYETQATHSNRLALDTSNPTQSHLNLNQRPALATPLAPVSNWNTLGAMPSLLQSNSNQLFELSLKPGDLRISQYLHHFLAEHNWTLEWAIDRDFVVHHPATFKGNFLDILTQLATSLGNTDTPVKIELYNDNHVLRITYSNR